MLGVLEASLGGQHEAGNGVKTGVLKAQATLLDGYVGDDVGVGGQRGFVGDCCENLLCHDVSEFVGEGAIPKVDVWGEGIKRGV